MTGDAIREYENDTETETRRIPIETWCALCREDAAPPVTILLDGDSMRPLIRRGRDRVTIVPLLRELKKGDIVLFRLGGRYIVHRVRRLNGDTVETLGDACLTPDPAIPRAQVLGLAVRCIRNGRTLRLDTPAARALGRLWTALYPCRRLRAAAGRLAARLRR